MNADNRSKLAAETDIRAKLAAENAKPDAHRDLVLIYELAAPLFRMTRQPANMGAGTVATRQPAMSDHTTRLVRVALECKAAYNVQLAIDAINSEPAHARDLGVILQLWQINNR